MIQEIRLELSRDQQGAVVLSYFQDNARILCLSFRTLEKFEDAVDGMKEWIKKEKGNVPLVFLEAFSEKKTKGGSE